MFEPPKNGYFPVAVGIASMARLTKVAWPQAGHRTICVNSISHPQSAQRTRQSSSRSNP